MTKHLIYGTRNPSKITQVQQALKHIDITISGLGDVDTYVEEDGKTPEENARKKSLAYAQATGNDVLSMDTGLYFEGVDDHLQPGLHVRRIPGNPSALDKEMIEYYADLIKKHGGQLYGFWEFSFALSSPDGSTKSFTARTKPRLFIDTPHPTILPGYPLSSLQVNENKEYFLDKQQDEREAWDIALGKPLAKFITKHYDI
jgi:hypothetical protein